MILKSLVWSKYNIASAINDIRFLKNYIYSKTSINRINRYPIEFPMTLLQYIEQTIDCYDTYH